MRLSILPFVVLALAACSQAEPAPTETASAVAAATSAPASPTPASSTQIALVPNKFRGIWDSKTGTCDPASEMRVEIAERGITFYESHGAVTAVTTERTAIGEVIVVDLTMQGEGERWTTRRRISLDSDPDELSIAELDARFHPVLKRCA